MIKLLTAALLALAAPAAAQTGCLVSGVLNLETPRVGVTPAYVAANCVNRSLIKLSTAMASAADFTALSASTVALAGRATTLEVWQGTMTPHIATYDVWKGTISPAIAGKADKGNTAHIDLSTVTTALAGKAPLTGAGTSGTWGISVTGTAAALAADPADAASGYVSRGINASGTVQPAWVETAATSGSTNPVTSGAMFTALSGKQASGNYITALTGDVTAAGPGSAAATIANLPAISGANLTNLTAANIANGTMGTVNTGGNAATATALAANPADCAANQFANAISASGALSCAAIADADVPNTITVDLAATATALVATPGNCVSGEFYTGLTANGTRTCAAPSGGGDMVLASTQTVSGAKIFTSSVTVGALVYTATATTSGFDQAGRGSVIVNSWMIVASTNPSAATAAIFYGLQNRRWYRVRYNLTHNTTSGAMNVTFNEVGGTAYSWVNQCFHSNLLSETSGSSGGGSWRQDGVTNSFAGRVRSGWFEFYNDGNNLKGNSNFSTTINADPVTNACNGALTLSSAITLESVKMESSAGTLTGSIYLEQLIAPNP